MSVGLSDFPSFTSATQLFKALRQQGFEVTRRGPGYRVAAADGNQVFIHSGSITDRMGNRQRNVLKELVRIGFVPPDQFKKQQRVAQAAQAARADAEQQMEEAVQPAPEVLPEAPVGEPDPKRAYPCPACAEERCRKCVHEDWPCAFPQPLNLGRHRTSIHGVAPQPRSGKPRASRVRTRVDPDVIPNVVARRIVQLRKLTTELTAVLEALVGEVETLRKENQELRAFKSDVEKRANALYDATTKPRG